MNLFADCITNGLANTDVSSNLIVSEMRLIIHKKDEKHLNHLKTVERLRIRELAFLDFRANAKIFSLLLTMTSIVKGWYSLVGIGGKII